MNVSEITATWKARHEVLRSVVDDLADVGFEIDMVFTRDGSNDRSVLNLNQAIEFLMTEGHGRAELEFINPETGATLMVDLDMHFDGSAMFLHCECDDPQGANAYRNIVETMREDEQELAD